MSAKWCTNLAIDNTNKGEMFMKNTLFPACVIALFCSGAGVFAQYEEQGELPSAQLVRYSFKMPNAENLPRNYSGFMPGEIGCEITYLLEGENFIHIPRDALEITSINNSDGEDISVDGDGLPTWKHETSSGGVSDDRKKAVVSVFVRTFGPITVPVPRGYVTVKTARSIKTETVTMRTGDVGKKSNVGPFVVAHTTGEGMWGKSVLDTFAEAEPVDSGDLGENADDLPDPLFSSGEFRVHITGPVDLLTIFNNQPDLKSMEIGAGEKTVKFNGGVGLDDFKMFKFPYTPNTKTFTLTLSYYDDVGEVVYKLGD